MENDGVTPDGEQPEGEPIFRDPWRAAGADRATLSALALEAVAEIDREISRAQARRSQIVDRARVLAESAAEHVVLDSAPRGKVDELGYRSFISEMAAMLRVPEATARSQVAEAKTLQRNLPQTREAFAAGEISQAHVRRIIDQSWSLPSDGVAEYENAVLPAARTQTPARFSRTARVVREKLHPESIVTRREKAAEGRCVEFHPLSDGMAFVGVTHTADVASALYNATMEQAQSLRSASEPRTLPQLAADVFADVAIAGFLDPQPGVDTPPLPLNAATASLGEGGAGKQNENGVGYESALLAHAEAGLTAVDVAAGTLSVTLKRRAVPARVSDNCSKVTDSRRRTTSSGPPRAAPPVRPPSVAATSMHDDPHATAIERAACVALAEEPRRPRHRDDGQELPAASEQPAAQGLRSALGVGDRRRAIRPSVMVTVPVLSLIGASDEPSSLEGYGPIDTETARELAANAPSFTRLLTHPETGAVVSVGRDSYRVPADLKRALQARDVTCRFPGCNRKAVWCDVDHTQDWQYGGETTLSNLAHFCRKHHTLKHGTRWRVTQDDSGVMTFTSPVGNIYVTQPDRAMVPRAGSPGAAAPGTSLKAYGDDPPF